MSDDRKVIDLASARERRAKIDDDNITFTFTYRDDLAEPDAPVWSTKGGDVVILLDGPSRTGLAFSAEAARRLGVSLIEAAYEAQRSAESDDAPKTDGA